MIPADLSLEAYEDHVVALCFSAAPAETDFARLGAPERWKIYRRMVRSRISKVCVSAMPRTMRCLPEERRKALFSQWMAEDPPRTRIFRELPVQFGAWAKPHLLADSRAWLSELAEYELLSWTVRTVDERNAQPSEALSFERPVVMSPSVRLFSAAHAVHIKRADEAYPQERVFACLYRDPDTSKAVTMSLSPFIYDLMRRWHIAPAESLTESVQRTVTARGSGIDTKLIDGLSGVLADFLQRGVLLGSLPSSA